ncbi:MAG: cytochrome-c peroxidase, partial [Pseudomonadota bacterium]|nr:cytochrome-c peroxidase [Pseudomonadota bacterium]
MKTLILASAVLLLAACGSDVHDWDAGQQAAIRSLWIGNLGDPPPDPTNPVADDPRAAALGQRLFFDTRFSANGRVACATCHQPDRLFSDAAVLGAGIGPTRRHTP